MALRNRLAQRKESEMTVQCLHYMRPGQTMQRITTVDAHDYEDVRIGSKVMIGGWVATVTAIHGTVPALPPDTVEALLKSIVSPRLRSDQYEEETGMAYPALTDDSIFSERLAPEMQWSSTSERITSDWMLR